MLNLYAASYTIEHPNLDFFSSPLTVPSQSSSQISLSLLISQMLAPFLPHSLSAACHMHPLFWICRTFYSSQYSMTFHESESLSMIVFPCGHPHSFHPPIPTPATALCPLQTLVNFSST